MLEMRSGKKLRKMGIIITTEMIFQSVVTMHWIP